jgi:hypothetical protein
MIDRNILGCPPADIDLTFSLLFAESFTIGHTAATGGEMQIFDTGAMIAIGIQTLPSSDEGRFRPSASNPGPGR